jgi:pleckstrin homology domain-containing family A member 1/2
VLRPAHLAYYKTSAEYQLHRLVDLQEVHTCTPVALKRRDNTFGVVTATRTYYLQAESQVDAKAWVAAIREAKEAQLASTASATAPLLAPSSTPIPIPGRPRIPVVTPSPPSRTLHAITSSESEEAASPHTQRMFATSSSPAVPPSSSPRIGGPDASKVVMSGYITKMGKRRNWRKRWFLLNGEMLMYAGSHMVSNGDRCGSSARADQARGNDYRIRRCTDKYRFPKF